MKTALILSGGGSRAAYQAGVLKGLGKIIPSIGVCPFQIICGTSAGAINASAVAAGADQFNYNVQMLEELWSNLRTSDIYEGSSVDLAQSAFRLVASLFRGGVGSKKPLALLDNAPLRKLLQKHVNFERIPEMIDRGFLHALSITAIGYTSGHSVSFFQGRPELKSWQRSRRIGIPTQIRLEHLMASTAIPTIFPAERIHREYFGDGAVRQTSPMSAALHLGAERLLVIGVSGNMTHHYRRVKTRHTPSMAQIMGQFLNSAFLDSMETDIELLQRFNKLLAQIPENKHHELGMRPVKILTIVPSIAFDNIAAKHIRDLPSSMRWLVRITGATRYGGGASLTSYLLFERAYCAELIKAGYRDVMNQSREIREFFKER